MKSMKKYASLLCLLVMLLAVPVTATEPQTQPETETPRIIGVAQLSAIGESWSPLEASDRDALTLLALTSEPLYRLDAQDGVVPAQAGALPKDVTGEFAGSYGISPNAKRGYAFAITLREGACWEDGTPVSPGDWHYTLEKMLEHQLLTLEIANYGAYLRSEAGPAARVISLQEAGYSSVEEAKEAGVSDFYVDTTHYWGLDAGWQRITDRTRLWDTAIPSGCEEMYVTPAYLYTRYLSDTGSESMFQSEFVGIAADPGEKMTMADVGLLVQEDRLILILQEPSTRTHVALALADRYPLPQGASEQTYATAENYKSCGPYRIVSVTDTQIDLEPNPYWTGEAAEFAEAVCRTAS